MKSGDPEQKGYILFFDGYCNLCNAWVNRILDNEGGTPFYFSPLSSEYANATIPKEVVEKGGDSVILYKNGVFYTASSAALHVAKAMKAPYFLLWPFIFLPKFLRDPIYNLIARNRYKWFGKRQECRVPSEEEKDRFLQEAPDNKKGIPK